jgi:GNAT superfamily N-acetyltransferase
MIATIVWNGDTALIEEFYRVCGYSGGVEKKNRQIITAIESGLIIGVVRICQEEGFTVIRGMQVADSHRRGGVGTLLLDLAVRKLKATRKVCWLIAYLELEGFYGQGGFHFVEDNDPCAPQHLQERLAKYQRENPKKRYTLMLR